MSLVFTGNGPSCVECHAVDQRWIYDPWLSDDQKAWCVRTQCANCGEEDARLRIPIGEIPPGGFDRQIMVEHLFVAMKRGQS